MRSFFFWLATAGAVGALSGTTVRPGFPEIVIVWAAVVGMYYGVRFLGTQRRSAEA